MELNCTNADAVFSYHKATPEQIEQMDAIRRKAKELALLVLEHCPEGSDKEEALRSCRLVSLWGNASIVLRSPDPSI